MNKIVTWEYAAPLPAMDHPDNIVFFDGVCNLCNGLVKFIIKRDVKNLILFSPLQSPFGQATLKKMKMDPEEVNTVVYFSGDKPYLKSSAILQILKDMGGAWKLLFGLIVVPRFIRDFIYDLVARNRYKVFGKQESCMVPTPEVKNRFIV